MLYYNKIINVILYYLFWTGSRYWLLSMRYKTWGFIKSMEIQDKV